MPTTDTLRDEAERLVALADKLESQRAWTAWTSLQIEASRIRREIALADEIEAENARRLTPLQRLRAMRGRAEKSGSHTAASSLAAQEREIEEAERVERQRKREERDAAKRRTGDALVDDILELIAGLDDIARERIHQASAHGTRARFRG